MNFTFESSEKVYGKRNSEEKLWHITVPKKKISPGQRTDRPLVDP